MPYVTSSAFVAAFRSHPKLSARGAKVGITNNCDWNEPGSSSPADIAAAERANEWWLAWFADPIWLGDYPASMKAKLGSRLPEFTAEEKRCVWMGHHHHHNHHHLHHRPIIVPSSSSSLRSCTCRVASEGGHT